MAGRMRRLIALMMTVVLVAGCAAPGAGRGGDGAAQERATATERKTPAGTPWKDWFIQGVLSEGDEIRLEDDFYTAVNRDRILAYAADSTGGQSTIEVRENEIANQMMDLLESDAQGTQGTAHDLACLRSLYSLYADWDDRDKDGCEPVKPIVERIRKIKSLDEMSDWLCSDDFRLSLLWSAGNQTDEDASLGCSLFALLPYNDVDDPAAGGYFVEIPEPILLLAPFEWDDEDLMQDGSVDETVLESLRAASTNVDIAYRMLMHMGLSDKEAADTVCNAAALESLLLEGLDVDGNNYVECTHDELIRECKGSFPLDRIVDAYGYGDAASYELDNRAWLQTMNELYKEEYLDLFVSHALTGLALRSTGLLDTEASEIEYSADGDAYISDELLETASAEEEGDDAGEQLEDESLDMTDEEYAAYLRREGSDYLRETLPTSFAKVYVEHFYDERVTDEVSDLVRSYIDAYQRMLAAEDWIGESTRANAIEKLRAMRVQVGHPQMWANTDSLGILSHDEGGSLFSETRRLAAYELEQEKYLLHRPDEGEYWRNCMDVNAYYTPARNSVTIGVGILGGGFWREDATFEQKLGGTGMTIGHEISHAFDTDGAYFDKDGKYANWWTDEDWAAFEARVKRVVDCFSAIDPIGTGTYDGTQVCGEAIADLGAIKATMQMAKQREGFDYDAFFRAYAFTWASALTEETVESQMEDDTHPIDSHRVNVPVREVDEFNETYGIKEGDGMWLSPDERISVW